MQARGPRVAGGGPHRTSRVGPRRGAGVTAGPSPRPALRTRRACLHAPGSPRAHAAGASDPAVQRSGSLIAQWCSPVCIASTRAFASIRLGHGAPVFTSVLLVVQQAARLAGPLRPVTGSPGPRGRSSRLRLLRVLRPTPAASADDGPSRPASSALVGEGPPGWFPRSLCNRSSGEVSGYAPAASPHLRRRLRGLDIRA